jgi:signal transduction histidine kinase
MSQKVSVEPQSDDIATAAEAKAGHAQRTEAVGLMAAGVTHELSNLLTIVLAGLHQLRRQSLDAHGEEVLERTEWGARQAGRLIRQVLSLARQQKGSPELVNLSEVVQGFDKMLTHMAGENVEVVLQLAPQLLLTRAAPDQLELALLNLVRNASDAMAGVGRIVVRTSGRRIDGLGRQPTVEISVTDTGSGMAPDAAQHAADAFFTTKQPGDGTGLGLWMVQRFMTECEGKLDIETVPEQGTTVRLVFPRAGQGE